MIAPFELPEGLSWGALTDHDRRWLEGNGEGSIPMGRGVPTEQHAHLDIVMTLRRRSTGEARVYRTDWCPFLPTTKDDLLRGVLFQWTEGNFSCNCNRSIFWAEAGGEPAPDETPCDIGDDRFEIVAPEWLARADRGEEPFGDFYELTEVAADGTVTVSMEPMDQSSPSSDSKSGSA